MFRDQEHMYAVLEQIIVNVYFLYFVILKDHRGIIFLEAHNVFTVR